MVRIRALRGWMLVLALALAGSTPAAAQIYKWTDAHGRVHYGDRAGGRDARTIVTDTDPRGLGMDADEARAQQRLLRTLDDERAADQQAQQKAAAAEKQRELNCARARDRRRGYRNARYVYEPQANGERRILTDTERLATEARAEQAVRHWCGN